MTVSPGDPLLTLEPFLDAVREGVEAAGWTLSGLQKTTSHQFEGRWAGDSTRSAYLFFHHPSRFEDAAVDVYLDETSRGLSGNLALVLDLLSLEDLPATSVLLSHLAAVAGDELPRGYGTPLTLRFRLPDPRGEVGSAETEVRFKVRIPREALEAGHGAVSALSSTVVHTFQKLLLRPELQRLMPPPE